MDDELECPWCSHKDVLDAFDDIGACPACVFCPNCNKEFNLVTGEKHKPATCCWFLFSSWPATR